MKKILILVYENGAKWAIPVHEIADNRAKYYAEKDKNTTYQEEYDFVMKDDYEPSDWFFNQMNWEDLNGTAFEINPPRPFDPSDTRGLVNTYLETE